MGVISLIISALILCSLSTISAYTITNSTSINTGIGSTPGGDTLYLQPGNYSKPNDAGIIIGRNIVIQGNGSTDSIKIDARGTQNIFTINGNYNVRFVNLTFYNGRTTGASSYGGAVNNNNPTQGGTMTFINCTFINNTSGGYGGAIAKWNTGNLIVNNCTFINNTASARNGGAIYNQLGTANVTGSTFINNKAVTGGGIQ